MANVVVLVEDLYEELELWYPYHRLREAGHELILVGPEIRTYHGRYGYPAAATATPEMVSSESIRTIVIPGGYAPDRMRRSKAVVGLVQELHAAGAVVGAICHAGWMLIEADIVRGHKLTGFHSISRDLVNAGGSYVDEPVVIDGRLITSRSPDDLPSFGAALVAATAET